MAPTIDIIRHAQAVHNVQGCHVRDPPLTVQGRRECAVLFYNFPYKDKITDFIASPLRRAVETALLGIGPAIAPKKVILMPELQEVCAMPSSTGSPAYDLQSEFGNMVDLTYLRPDWYLKGPGTEFEPEWRKVEFRARKMRLWLREVVARNAPADAHIIIVTHGEFAHWLTKDFSGVFPGRNSGWANAEFRSYQFEEPDGEDREATLVETKESQERRLGHLFSYPSPVEEEMLKDNAIRQVQKHARRAEEWDSVRNAIIS
ncbi:histidine phosphatase superfamily [Xylariaceae sp. FL0662B]|nr:histidine phosphatase superfamily [Xylariaceae sp. FL0662B]